MYVEHNIEWNDEKISRLWDYYSRTPPYSEIYFSKLFGRRILEMAGPSLSSPLEFLDFGCGIGHIWDHLVDAGSSWSYTGIDFSPSSVTALKKRAAGSKNFRRVELVENLPTSFLSGSFDVIFLIEVIEHLSDAHLSATLVEARRLLRPGGKLVVTTPNQENLELSTRFCPDCGSKFHEWQHVRTWDASRLDNAFANHNLNLVWSKSLDFRELGWSLPAFRSRIKRLIKAMLLQPASRPHLIAIFTSEG